jgi:hypothetical protein
MGEVKGGGGWKREVGRRRIQERRLRLFTIPSGSPILGHFLPDELMEVIPVNMRSKLRLRASFRAKALAPEEAMHTLNAISYSSKGKKGIVRRFGDTRMMRLGF